MDTHLALGLKAMGIGLAVAAPVGPMALLCMRRTLGPGWRMGLATGFGIALADGLYALVAALGLAGLSRILLAYERPLHGVAGLVLLGLGLRSLFARPAADHTETNNAVAARWGRTLFGTTLLTLANPPTILIFAALFAALAPPDGLDATDAIVTVGGVVAGSLLWWSALVAVLTFLRRGINARARRWIDRVAGVILVLYGLADLASLWLQ